MPGTGRPEHPDGPDGFDTEIEPGRGARGAAVEVADYPFATRLPASFMMPFETEKLQYARVWNAAGFDGLRGNRDDVLADEDVVELHI